jgi:hypothetical protein
MQLTRQILLELQSTHMEMNKMQQETQTRLTFEKWQTSATIQT